MKDKKITLQLAKALSEGIRIHAEELGMKVVVAVCNSQGRIITVDVMDDAFLVSYDVATKKAYTAVAVKMSTSALGEATKEGGALEGFHSDELIFFGGGEPLKIDGEIVGGLGVSGGTVDEDERLGKFGVKLFEALIREFNNI